MSAQQIQFQVAAAMSSQQWFVSRVLIDLLLACTAQRRQRYQDVLLYSNQADIKDQLLTTQKTLK